MLTWQAGSVTLGIDPGPKPGLVLMRVTEDGHLTVRTLTPEQAYETVRERKCDNVVMERFVIGPGTARKTRKGTHETLDMIGRVQDLCADVGIPLTLNNAGTVKPWATDTRLRMFEVMVRGDHHRDAARHALFNLVASGRAPRRPVHGWRT